MHCWLNLGVQGLRALAPAEDSCLPAADPSHVLSSNWVFMSFQVAAVPHFLQASRLKSSPCSWNSSMEQGDSGGCFSLPSTTCSSPHSGKVFAKPGWIGSVIRTAWFPLHPMSHTTGRELEWLAGWQMVARGGWQMVEGCPVAKRNNKH